MIDSDAGVLKPYEAQWRPNLVTGWLMVKQLDTLGEAREVATLARNQWGGQTRIVSQHVIEHSGVESREAIA
jgi:hypothetical protein